MSFWAKRFNIEMHFNNRKIFQRSLKQTIIAVFCKRGFSTNVDSQKGVFK